MKLQFVRLRKRLSTVLTHARLFLSVRASHVTIMRRVRGECTLTVLALEWLLPAVLTYVRAQNRRSSEGLDAVRTFVRSLAAVNSHVFVEAGGLREAFTAYRAFVRTVLLVHVQHVDTQAIPLVEGAVTNGAWELPVSCVNAPRVFKMAVTVVFVGEHFPAPFTFIIS